MWTTGGFDNDLFLKVLAHFIGFNNWRITLHTIHRFYASLASLLAKHITTMNMIIYRIVKVYVCVCDPYAHRGLHNPVRQSHLTATVLCITALAFIVCCFRSEPDSLGSTKEARGLAQHGGPPGWLEESDPRRL
jgi:hypothetical protein